jgi:hypothetical protein
MRENAADDGQKVVDPPTRNAGAEPQHVTTLGYAVGKLRAGPIE